MAAGVPPVASRVGGVPELIEDGSGTLVPPDDPVALSEGLAEVLENVDRASAMSERARRRARAYSDSTTDQAYGRLFAWLAGRLRCCRYTTGGRVVDPAPATDPVVRVQGGGISAGPPRHRTLS